jgi:NAD(P)-dependent dehydrogenase (short-subunit alcohol dehydrogenase family)
MKVDMVCSGRLAGKVTVLIGAAGRLGRVFARSIVREGGSVVLADCETGNCERLKEQLLDEYPAAAVETQFADTSDADSIRALLSTTASLTGRIDAVVNAAYPRGPGYGARFEEVLYANFTRTVSQQIGGYFLVSQLFSMFFKQRGNGNVINISSIYGVVPPRFDIYDGTSMTMPVEYAVAKAALLHLTKYLASYFSGSGIRFNCISPGGILDAQPESFVARYNAYAMSKGMLDAEDICGALVFLLSDDSRYVNGQNLIVDDGWTN